MKHHDDDGWIEEHLERLEHEMADWPEWMKNPKKAVLGSSSSKACLPTNLPKKKRNKK